MSIGGATVVDIPIQVPTSCTAFKAALWWPESVQQTHSDMDLYLINSDGIAVAAATDVPSVFERTLVKDPTSGGWTLRIQGVPGVPEQTVYWAADLVECDEITQLP
jgi:hypothetical protein